MPGLLLLLRHDCQQGKLEKYILSSQSQDKSRRSTQAVR